MERLLTTYRVFALIVSVFVIFVVGGWILKMLVDEGSGLYSFGELTASISPVHGLFYMILLVVTAMLSRRAGWPVGFTIATMLLATIPFVSFLAEHRATERTREAMAAEQAALASE
ncbi:integral membrane protein [Mumia flava]|uniref:Integral membrane protein n=1 Tax=Mumia flava TaxID=1348852 RepID=A0A0B2B6E6_9ACTN|nr:DUF3817 domain-containing protein [Mumia flava]PJJ57619.1 integral membrane protein [Mumia flava]